jgi:hypothetical protein
MMKKILTLLLSLVSLASADDRIGYHTQFAVGGNAGYPHGTAINVPAFIESTGVVWVRDHIGWTDIEQSQGVYGGTGFDAARRPWLDYLHAQGLKVVICFQAGPQYSPSFYPNQYDPAMAQAAAWFATQTHPDGTPICDVLEFLNEPNNGFKQQYGSTWLTSLTSLNNTVYNAVKAANANMTFIGLGVQGQDIITCLQNGATVDGIVAHPYDTGDAIPEHCYEPPYFDYQQFKAALNAAAPGKPLWYTEQGCDNGHNEVEYNGAVWDARRLLLAFGIGVEHSFLFQFLGSSVPQSVVGFNRDPLQAYFLIKDRIMPLLSGVASRGSIVSATNQDANWDAPNFKNFVFSNPNSYTVAALWFGNHSSRSDEGAPNSSVATVSFPLRASHKYGQSYVLDLITGAAETVLESNQSNPNHQPQYTGAGSVINYVTVSGNPVLVVVK